MSMAEAEQRSRLAIAQNESLVATDLAQRELALQETSIRGRLSLETLGTILGAVVTLGIVGMALAFAYIAPNSIEKGIAALVAVLGAAATLIGAFKKPSGSSSSVSQKPGHPAPPPSQNRGKRRR